LPIHKDRQFLFVSTDIQRNSGPLTTNLCHGDPVCQADTGPVIPVPANGTDTLGPACAGAIPGVTHLLPGCYGVADLGALEGAHTQFQDFFTILGHYDYQFSPANHFSIRGLGTRNHTRGFTGGHGQSETFDAFGDTEDFVNQGISGVFALTTVLGRKVNEIRVSVEGETRKRHPIFKGAPEKENLASAFICPAITTMGSCKSRTISRIRLANTTLSSAATSTVLLTARMSSPAGVPEDTTSRISAILIQIRPLVRE
jgi:hypothetical protein